MKLSTMNTGEGVMVDVTPIDAPVIQHYNNAHMHVDVQSYK